MLMEGDPFSLIEGLVIAGLAVGAAEGYIYVRSEYPDAIATMAAAIDVAYLNSWLGSSVLASGRDLRPRTFGSGPGPTSAARRPPCSRAWRVAGGDTRQASAAGRGRALWQAAVVNNVLSLAAVPLIVANGAEAFAELGVGRSRGTQVFQLAGNVKHGGIFETAFGLLARRAR